MIRALYTSATGMEAQKMLVDVTANNLANVNTTGFKRSHLEFADLLYVTRQQAGSELFAGQPAPTGLQVGSGVKPVSTTKLFTFGVPEQTGNPLDVAIEGDGFIRVTHPDGDRYTRDGALRIDRDGNLLAGGLPLAAGIQIPAGTVNISIGPNGVITGQQGGQTTQEPLGTIQLSRFANPAGLSSEGGNLYAATNASGDPIDGNPGELGLGALLQNHLEKSNVEVVTELVQLISAQRAYEVNSRAIRAADEMLSVSRELVR